MTNLSMAFEELLRKSGVHDADFLREAVGVLCQALMELEVSRKVGAERYQRTDQRVTHRNGYRTREWDTRVGPINLRIPKLRAGVEQRVDTKMAREDRRRAGLGCFGSGMRL